MFEIFDNAEAIYPILRSFISFTIYGLSAKDILRNLFRKLALLKILNLAVFTKPIFCIMKTMQDVFAIYRSINRKGKSS